MSKESETDKAPIITEDTRVKTNIKTIAAVLVGVATGTYFFFAVMSKLDSLDSKIDSYDKATRMQLNYLYHATNVFNPFEGNSNAFPTPTATLPIRGAPSP